MAAPRGDAATSTPVRKGQDVSVRPIGNFASAVESARDGAGFVWLGLHEPSAEQLEQLGIVFSLHPLALEDAATPRQRPNTQVRLLRRKCLTPPAA